MSIDKFLDRTAQPIKKDKLKRGDTVRLNSGGPAMEVTEIGLNGGYGSQLFDYVNVVWMDWGSVQSARLPEVCLTKADR